MYRRHLVAFAFLCFTGLVANTAVAFSTTNKAITNTPRRQTTSTTSTSRSTDLPEPPCPRSNPSDDTFRSIRNSWPIWLQNFLRESGLLRTIEDTVILFAIPELLKEYPSALDNFLELSRRTTRIQYGSHGMQYLDLIEPNTDNNDIHTPNTNRGVVAFVHGGAWGSGKPWMYRLAAIPFLQSNQAVAILGYRTYPDADSHGQVEDIGLALNTLANERPDLLDEEGRIDSLVCHSTGAHIGLLHVIESAMTASLENNQGRNFATKTIENETPVTKSTTQIKRYVGLSGVYCINSHFDYEAGRGVEQLATLRAANGPGRTKFREASPAYRLECFADVNTGDVEECVLLDDDNNNTEGGEGAGSAPIQQQQQQVLLDEHTLIPEMLFVHGLTDDVVPYNQTNVVVDALRSSPLLGNTPDQHCQELLLENVDHADTVFHLMFGGVTRDVVLGEYGQVDHQLAVGGER